MCDDVMTRMLPSCVDREVSAVHDIVDNFAANYLADKSTW